MAERVIKHKVFTYREEADDPLNPGKTVLRERLAYRGETVDLTQDIDIRRGELHGAFRTEEDEEPEVGEVAVADMSNADLVDWIEDEEPTVTETVDAAGDDPGQARRILDAESQATGGDPRKGVEDGLNKVIEG